MAEPDKPRGSSLINWLQVVIGVVAAAAGAAGGVFSAIYWVADRDSRLRKQDFDNAVAIAGMYFERVNAPGQSASVCRDTVLYGDAALIMAGLDPQEVRRAFDRRRAAPDGAPPAPPQGPERALQGMALLIFSDVNARQAQCNGDGIAVTDTAPGQVANAEAVPGATTSYALRTSVAAQAPAPGGQAAERFTVFIQYQRDNAAARSRAEDLRQRIDRAGPMFRAPGTEGVRQVPGTDQIRIYRADDADEARQLQQVAGLGSAQIVNLQNAFPNLPPRTMEVWLGTR
jgi:hypothetical protein